MSRQVCSSWLIALFTFLGSWGALLAYPDTDRLNSMTHCSSCHNGAANPSAAAQINGLPDRFEPGTRYDLNLTMSGGQRYGFQLVASHGSGGGMAGTLQSVSPNTLVNGSMILSNSTDLANPVVEFAWTAPLVSDPVTFHVIALIANGNGGTGGDTMVEIEVQLEAQVSVAQLSLENPGSQHSTVGTSVELQLQTQGSGDQLLEYSASGLPPGLGIDPDTGKISGTLQSDSTGTYAVTATVTAGSETSSVTFNWYVLPDQLHQVYFPHFASGEFSGSCSGGDDRQEEGQTAYASPADDDLEDDESSEDEGEDEEDEEDEEDDSREDSGPCSNPPAIASTITLLNLSQTSTTAGTVEFLDLNGAAIDLEINGEPTDGRVPFVIPIQGMVEISTSGRGMLVLGSVTVSSDQPVHAALTVQGALGWAGFESTSAMEAFAAPVSFPQAVRGFKPRIGVALMNLEAVETVVHLELVDPNGEVLTQTRVQIPALGQIASPLEELFGRQLYGFTGMIRGQTDQGSQISAALLGFGKKQLWSIPAIPLTNLP